MLQKILNIGVSDFNDENLNRKIRISNLIAVLSIVIMLSFVPVSLYFHTILDLILTAYFITASLSNIILHSRRRHTLAFCISVSSGFIYFIFATLIYGLVSNLHFYMLIMCMIVIVIFDNPYVIKAYIAVGIVSFFALMWFMKNRAGLIDFPEMRAVQAILGQIILFLLFIITAIFFLFFKTENLTFQKAVMHQKEIIEEKNKDITASITYAKRLQEAILPSQALIDKTFPDSFIFYRPKDIVAGDFYWLEKSKEFPDIALFAAADCTGHGVPGAMVSVVCSNALNRAVKEFGITDPGKILDKIRDLVIETFDHKGSDEEITEGDVKDGMDISLFSLNSAHTELKWAGANNPLMLIRNNSITEYKPDKQPIGKTDAPKPFTTHTITLEKGDRIYTFSDGFADQFGGPKGKKFKFAHLKETLSLIHQLPMKKQADELDRELLKWRGNLEQVDDILIVGLTI